jgi:NitT/TauT family transport system permease protein
MHRWQTDLLSLGSLLLLWGILATEAHSPLLPSPWRVLDVFIQETESMRLPFHLGMTLLRLMASFAIAMISGITLGILLGLFKGMDRFFGTWLTIALNIPALVSIILCYVWFGLNEFSAILAVILNKVPNVIVILREGTRQLSKDLLEMAKAYRLGPYKIMRHVIWPQLFPYIMTAARTGLSLIWKIVLVVELLGRSNGMGYQLHLYFQMFDVAGILAYSFAFIALVQCIEWFCLAPLDRRAERWRR